MRLTGKSRGASRDSLFLKYQSAKEDKKAGSDNTGNDPSDEVGCCESQKSEKNASEKAAYDACTDVPEHSALTSHDAACEPAAKSTDKN